MQLEITLGVRKLTINRVGHWFCEVTNSGDTLAHVFGFDLLSLVRTYPRLWRVLEEIALPEDLHPEQG